MGPRLACDLMHRLSKTLHIAAGDASNGYPAVSGSVDGVLDGISISPWRARVLSLLTDLFG